MSGLTKDEVIPNCSVCGNRVDFECYFNFNKIRRIKDIKKKPTWCPLKEKENG
jgi:hypothetical protein